MRFNGGRLSLGAAFTTYSCDGGRKDGINGGATELLLPRLRLIAEGADT